MKLVFVFALCLIACVQGWTMNQPVSTHPDHPGKCWISHLEKAVDAGESITHNCAKYDCKSDFSYDESNCPLGQPGPPCVTIPQDNSKPFPKCCSSYSCPPS